VALIEGRCLIEDGDFSGKNGIRTFATHTDPVKKGKSRLKTKWYHSKYDLTADRRELVKVSNRRNV